MTGVDVKIEGTSPQLAIAGERRYLTVVFSDLVGYTQLSEQIDPEDLRDLQLKYQRAALTVMEDYGGFVASYSGDGILVYFGYPTAHENDAERAVRAALELLERVPQVEVAPHDVAPLSVRIGIHTGLLVLGAEPLSRGRSEFGVVGEAVNLTHRLKDEAPINSIVVSRETHELVEGLFHTEPLGERKIRGLTRMIAIHKVIGARQTATRTTGRMRRSAAHTVGRKREAQTLLANWREAISKSRFTMVQVAGEAGVGKTRLIQDFCQSPAVANATVVRFNCLELFATTPLYAVASSLWLSIGLAVEDDEAARNAKIAAYLARFGADSPKAAATLASLLGFALKRAANDAPPTPTAVKLEQFAFLIWLMAQVVGDRPTLLWLEDAHWLDPSSAELLPKIVEKLADAPVLMLVTARSFPKGPALPPAQGVINLEQLAREDAKVLARSVPGAEALSDPMLERAIAACDGNPLFIEQMVLSLISQSERGNGARRGGHDLPLTLAEMMSERLDRVEDGRGVVQAAACVGRSFDAAFLEQLLEGSSRPVIEPLEGLVETEILRRRYDDAQTTYEFRHALLQRVAYESMVGSDRRRLHARIAQLLVQRSASEPIVSEVLAHHLAEAGRAEEAIKTWLEAAFSASRRSALVEAVAHVRSGLALLPSIERPERRRELELELQAALIGPLTGTTGVTADEFAVCCGRGMELSLEGEPTMLVFPFMFGQFTHSFARGQADDAVALAERFLALADRMSHDSARVVGLRIAGMAYLHKKGDLALARSHFERSIALYVPERDEAVIHTYGQNTEIHSRSLLSLTLLCAGEVEPALQMALDNLRVAEEHGHVHTTALALSYLGLMMGMCGTAEALTAVARRLIAFSEQHGLAPSVALGTNFVGWAHCLRGDLDKGIPLMEQTVEATEKANTYLGLSRYLTTLADARRRNGQLAGAVAASTRALEVLPADSKWFEPEVLRVNALVQRDLGPEQLAEAEQSLVQAAETARVRGLALYEHRCLVDLQELLGPQRQRPDVEARLQALAHIADLDRRAERAARELAPGLFGGAG